MKSQWVEPENLIFVVEVKFTVVVSAIEKSENVHPMFPEPIMMTSSYLFSINSS